MTRNVLLLVVGVLFPVVPVALMMLLHPHSLAGALGFLCVCEVTRVITLIPLIKMGLNEAPVPG